MQGLNVGCRRFLIAGTALLAICLAPSIARAQIDAGNIAGIATDQTGGALPGVSVTVRNLANGQMRTVATNAEGRYQVAALTPGRYSVVAELSGFASVVRPELTVNVGSTVDVNIQMALANVSETLTITGEAPLIESTNTSLSNGRDAGSARGIADPEPRLSRPHSPDAGDG